MTDVGAAMTNPRTNSIFPRIPGLESAKDWQETYFYVKNTTNRDLINLPDFHIGPPANNKDWRTDVSAFKHELDEYHLRLENFIDAGLSADDIVCTFIECRVLPIQARP